MHYIGTTNQGGGAIYFDPHTAERNERGARVCGTIGDGQYEGEVLVETGCFAGVTFADDWLGGQAFRDFVHRCDLVVLKRALLEIVEQMPIFSVRRDPAHQDLPLRSVARVAENGSICKVVA